MATKKLKKVQIALATYKENKVKLKNGFSSKNYL